jgi:hypothetical protein
MSASPPTTKIDSDVLGGGLLDDSDSDDDAILAMVGIE